MDMQVWYAPLIEKFFYFVIFAIFVIRRFPVKFQPQSKYFLRNISTNLSRKIHFLSSLYHCIKLFSFTERQRTSSNFVQGPNMVCEIKDYTSGTSCHVAPCLSPQNACIMRLLQGNSSARDVESLSHNESFISQEPYVRKNNIKANITGDSNAEESLLHSFLYF